MPFPEKAAVRLLDAVTALIAIADYVSGETFETYGQKAMLRDAVERRLAIIGEALTVFRRLDPVAAAAIADLPRAIQMRNFLVHDYGAVDDQIVWDVVTVHCPALQSVLTTLLASDTL